MADANQAADDLARAMAKVQEELALFSRVTQQTADERKDRSEEHTSEVQSH